MTTGSIQILLYWRLLLKIAHENDVQVHALGGQTASGLDWDGLYVVDDELGAGIALRTELPPEWLVWVLAHELGHHFAKLNPQLFSPFESNGAAAHTLSVFSRKRWGRWRRLHPVEERANQWAARTLIDKNKWNEAENRSPLDLDTIAASLELPIPAAFAWERVRRAATHGGAYVPINFDAKTWSAIEDGTKGRGGHQSLFRRVTANRRARTARVSFNDFSLARERLLTVRGGWRDPYERLLKAVFVEIQRAGGVSALFALD